MYNYILFAQIANLIIYIYIHTHVILYFLTESEIKDYCTFCSITFEYGSNQIYDHNRAYIIYIFWATLLHSIKCSCMKKEMLLLENFTVENAYVM